MRRFAGSVWCAAWALVLYAVHLPWRELGGLVDERLRWLELLVLAGGLIVGCLVGGFGRDAVRPGTRRCHAGLLRYLILPPAALTAAALLTLRALGKDDPIGVALSGFVAYWAGVDLAFAAWPLVCGRPYRFTGPIPREAERPCASLRRPGSRPAGPGLPSADPGAP